VLGCEHPETLTSVAHLGNVLSKQERYKEAEVMHRHAIEALEKVLGRKHLDSIKRIDPRLKVVTPSTKVT
jgi:2-phospho-L-lactate guanylyltransferase (CobY/MobA/RfbA family)